MELKVNEIKELPAVIFNYEDLKTELKENLKKYEGLVYTEENIKDAKSDRANLNKLSEAIDTERKRIKNKYLEPYNMFEKQIKDLEALIEEPKKFIDDQIKVYENKAKEQKRDTINFFFRSTISELAEVLKIEDVWNEKWLNATYKMDDIHNEIREVIERTRSDFKVIEDLKTEFELNLKDFYLKKRDLTQTMQEKIRLEMQKESLEKIQNNTKTEQKITDVQQKITNIEQKITITFKVCATKDELNKLAQFLKNNNIEYGKVE